VQLEAQSHIKPVLYKDLALNCKYWNADKENILRDNMKKTSLGQ